LVKLQAPLPRIALMRRAALLCDMANNDESGGGWPTQPPRILVHFIYCPSGAYRKRRVFYKKANAFYVN